MKIFQHPNILKEKPEETCLVCKKPEDKPVILVGIVGTEDGGNMQAKQIHVDCIDLLYYPEHSLLAQKLEYAD